MIEWDHGRCRIMDFVVDCFIFVIFFFVYVGVVFISCFCSPLCL